MESDLHMQGGLLERMARSIFSASVPNDPVEIIFQPLSQLTACGLLSIFDTLPPGSDSKASQHPRARKDSRPRLMDEWPEDLYGRMTRRLGKDMDSLTEHTQKLKEQAFDRTARTTSLLKWRSWLSRKQRQRNTAALTRRLDRSRENAVVYFHLERV